MRDKRVRGRSRLKQRQDDRKVVTIRAERDQRPSGEDEDFQTLSEIEPKEVEWLWEPLIPYGMVTIMEGDPNLGKSYLAMHFAVLVSTGGTLPNGQKIKRGRVLYLSTEDDAAITLRPRIDAMGGDPERIRFQARYSAFDDEGLEVLWDEVRRHPPDLIIIDPLYGYVPGGTNMYQPNEIRALLAKIAEVAAYCGAAVLVIRHLTKTKRDKAIYQGVGSIDVIGAARSAFLVAPHPDDEEMRVIAHVKWNLSTRGDSWQFQFVIGRGEKVPSVEWAGKCELTADDLLKTRKGSLSSLDQAIDFLRSELKDDAKPASEMLALAEKRGIAKRTLDRARDEIGVEAHKESDGWWWEFPQDD